MAKPQMQRNKEHLARIRRKAQAYDFMISQLIELNNFMDHLPKEQIVKVVRENVNGACDIQDGYEGGKGPYSGRNFTKAAR